MFDTFSIVKGGVASITSYDLQAAIVEVKCGIFRDVSLSKKQGTSVGQNIHEVRSYSFIIVGDRYYYSGLASPYI